jgi:fructose-bisphosphate aldolase class I
MVYAAYAKSPVFAGKLKSANKAAALAVPGVKAVIDIADGIPTWGCIKANAHALARYAALCQEAGLVPIVEPEVLSEGDHGLARCATVTEHVLRAVFAQLVDQRVVLEAMILKPAMVLPGESSREDPGADEVAEATVTSLSRVVPAAVPGIALLSGGQAGPVASARRMAMNLRYRGRLPWALSFSFGRALQHPALDIWHGDPRNVASAQAALVGRARCNQAARRGEDG